MLRSKLQYCSQQVMYIAASSSQASHLTFNRGDLTHAHLKTDDFSTEAGKTRDSLKKTFPFSTYYPYCTSALQTWNVDVGPLSALQSWAIAFLPPWHFEAVKDCDISSASFDWSENCANSNQLRSTPPSLICRREDTWRNQCIFRRCKAWKKMEYRFRTCSKETSFDVEFE